jgi:phage shock protein C
MEPKRLYRSNDKMLGGVCAGVADYFGIDKTIVRLIFAALILAGTVGFWLYLLMWIIVPQEP